MYLFMYSRDRDGQIGALELLLFSSDTKIPKKPEPKDKTSLRFEWNPDAGTFSYTRVDPNSPSPSAQSPSSNSRYL